MFNIQLCITMNQSINLVGSQSFDQKLEKATIPISHSATTHNVVLALNTLKPCLFSDRLFYHLMFLEVFGCFDLDQLWHHIQGMCNGKSNAFCFRRCVDFKKQTTVKMNLTPRMKEVFKIFSIKVKLLYFSKTVLSIPTVYILKIF